MRGTHRLNIQLLVCIRACVCVLNTTYRPFNCSIVIIIFAQRLSQDPWRSSRPVTRVGARGRALPTNDLTVETHLYTGMFFRFKKTYTNIKNKNKSVQMSLRKLGDPITSDEMTDGLLLSSSSSRAHYARPLQYNNILFTTNSAQHA